MNTEKLQNDLNQFWDDHIVPTLTEYIKIPNKSPAFDPDWETTGHMETALNLAIDWAEKHRPENSILHVKRLEGRTPLIMIEVPGEREGNILMYGHLDKQPEMEGWNEGLGPWDPVMIDEKLYGRGGADDGYAMFASLGAVKALKNQGLALPRIIVLIEFCEESGSPDLPYYIDEYADIIGNVVWWFALIPAREIINSSGQRYHSEAWWPVNYEQMYLQKASILGVPVD